eukprot:COSAG06_NODE_11079_length_1571_cov_1.449728_1_plen_416_part_10
MHRSASMASFAPLKRGPPPLPRAQQAPSDTAMGRARSHPRLDALAAERRQMLAEIDVKIAAAREAAAAAAVEKAQADAAAASPAADHVPQPYDPSTSDGADIDGAATCNRRAVGLFVLALSGDVIGIEARAAEVEAVANSQAAVRDPMAVNMVVMIQTFQLISAGDMESVNAKRAAQILALVAQCSSHPDQTTRHQCGMMAYSLPHLFDSVLMDRVSSASQSDPTWDAVFGKDGGSLRSLLAEYDYDRGDHAWLNRNINQDSLHLFGACWIAFAVHYGDIETALQQFHQSLEVARRSTEEADVVPEAIGLTMGPPILVHMALACDLPKDRRQALHGLLIAANATWDTAERKADEAAEAFPWFRPRGKRERNAGPLLTAESICWNTKCAWILSSNSSGSQQSAEVLASLPSVDEVID